MQKQVELHFTPSLVEIFHRGQRIASHPRRHKAGTYTTVTEHMPESHRQYAKWTPERLINWAKDEAGASTAKVASAIMLSKPHPQIGFKAVLGLMNLGRRYGADRLERACERALAIHSANYQTVKSTLRCGLEGRPLPTPTTTPTTASVTDHENIRGPAYYQ